MPATPDEPKEGKHPHVEGLRGFFTSLANEARVGFEVADPSPKLDLDSRAGSETRMFKHLHQMGLAHTRALKAANRIKLVYLIDAYLAMVDRKNPMGIYSAARSLLELSALLSDVSGRLRKIADSPTSWRPTGEQYFATVSRARYGTSDPDMLAALKPWASGPTLKPFNVMQCLEVLAQEPGHELALARYSTLCDFVHHNLSSNTTANAGTRTGTFALSPGGVGVILPKGGGITRFEYPLPRKADKACATTEEGALGDVRAIIKWLDRMPDGPYSETLLQQMTGSPLGLAAFTPPGIPGALRPGARKVGRNELCPCGSGRKHKRCCG